MVKPSGNGQPETGFLVVLVQASILQSPPVLVVLAGVLMPTRTFHVAVDVRLREFRQRQMSPGASVKEQPQLLPISYNNGRVVRKLHFRLLKLTNPMI
jgi:hypothetical protein